MTVVETGYVTQLNLQMHLLISKKLINELSKQMSYVVKTSGKNQGIFVDGFTGVVKADRKQRVLRLRLKAMCILVKSFGPTGKRTGNNNVEHIYSQKTGNKQYTRKTPKIHKKQVLINNE